MDVSVNVESNPSNIKKNENSESTKNMGCSCLSCSLPKMPKWVKTFFSWIKAILFIAAIKNLFAFAIYAYDIISK